MKGCPQWEEAIAECALGDPPQPGFATHLATCPPCENALRESRATAARIDEALHHSAAVEPPLYGPERVMAHIHAQSDTRGWWRWAAVVAAGLIAAWLIQIGIWVRSPAPEVAALSNWRSPTEALMRPPVLAAWTLTPRLGEGFFKLKPSGEIYAK
jgi:anti-sigma factor RsiW